MRKTRPVVVVSSDAVGRLPLRLVAPCTTSKLGAAVWRIPLVSTKENGLDRDTTLDLMQLRAVSTMRLTKRLGRVTDDQMEEIAAVIAMMVEYV